MKEVISFIKEEIRKRAGGVMRFVLSLICVCVAIWAMQPYVDALLSTIVIKCLDPLIQTRIRVIISFYLIISVGIAVFLCEHVRKKANISSNSWWIILFITIIYSYYRFSEQSPFEFWGAGRWRWLDVVFVVDIIILGCAFSYWIRFYRHQRKNSAKEGDLLLDYAITEAQYDFLDYNTRAHELMVSLSAVNLSRHAFSVGIVGDWGMGKSSLLNLFAKEVEKEGQILVRFSPRNAKKAEIIQEEFFTVFTKELCNYSYNAYNLIGKYAYALNVHSSTKWLYGLIEWFNKGDTAVKKERVNDMIRTTGKRVFVIIEDLDRMTGQEILEVLKLIDANGNFCNTVFLSAYDKAYVNGVLNHVIGYGKMQQDFTDKFFQYELPLFKHPNTVLYDFVTEKMYVWTLNLQTDKISQKAIQNEWRHVYPQLVPHIKTLRQAKRYINLFRMAYSEQKEEVDFADFAIVTLIRYLDIQSYYDLYNRKYLTFDGMLQTDRTQYKLMNDYQKQIGQSMIPNLSRLVSYLFDTSGVRQFDPQYNRLCRAESFEKYFYQTIKGKIYTGELNTMMNAADEAATVAIMQSFIDKSSNAKNSIREFLLNRQPFWIQTPSRLKRYVCMLLYAEGTITDIGLTGTINDMMHTQVAAGYEQFMTKETYIDSIVYAFTAMQPYVPLFIGTYMYVRLKERYSDIALFEDFSVESLSQDQTIMAEAQRYYDDSFGETTWSAAASIRLAIRIKGEDESSYKVRAMHLRRMINAHPDEYADAMIHFDNMQQRTPETHVSLNYYKEIVDVMGGQRNFKKWIKSISNKDMSYIIWELNYYAQSQFAHETGLGVMIDHPKNHYDKVAEIIRNSNARTNIRASKRKKKEDEK